MNKYIRYVFFFLLISGIVYSCKKKTPEDIGLPFLPDSDLLNAEFTDTLTLITHTVRDDSLRTDEAAPMLLGVINDPLFGITKSSIFTQLAISKTNPNFGSTPVLDSAVLSLVYSSEKYYGTLETVKFQVYQITEALPEPASSIYYSDQIVPFGPLLGSALLTPNVKDSIDVDTLKYPPHLRIYLDKTFFQSFLDNPGNYTSNASFISYFKGLHIATSSGTAAGKGAILYLDMAHAYSRVTLFYHNTTDTTSFVYPFTKDVCTRFMHFEHDYSADMSPGSIYDQLNSSSALQEDMVFVQPMAGVRTKITMPNITTMFGGKKVAINKAELILPVEPTAVDSPFYKHSKLVVTIADSLLHVLPDAFEGGDYFGGSYDSDKKEYRFNIGRYVQQVINGTRENEGLYLLATSSRTTANRTHLMGGSKTNSSRARLRITYTPLE